MAYHKQIKYLPGKWHFVQFQKG